MQPVTVRVQRLHEQAKLPKYSHTGNAGDLAADLFAVEDAEVQPGKVISVGTGLALELPAEYGAVIEDRSGTALKGLSTLAGIIDTGYRGEIRVVFTNVGAEPYQIRTGDRIAQLRLVHRLEANFVEVSEIGPSQRSNRGFGSTGT